MELMARNFFNLRIGPKRCLGVDIGTSVIKIVELSQQGKRHKLENYGEMEATSLYEKPFRTFEKSTLTISDREAVKAILAIVKEAKMKAKEAYFSIPDFSSFFTAFRLPAMTIEELPQAVSFEARQHIPLPLSEVVLDWQIIDQNKIDQKNSDFNILLVAVPNEVIRQYQEIAKLADLAIVALEAEVFGLARALVASDPSTAMLIDIGARSTTISVVDASMVKVSHSFDTAGNDFTALITRGLNLDAQEAEELKKSQGILYSETLAIREAILPLADLVITEAKKISHNFSSNNGKNIKKIILAGGSALLPGLSDYFKESMSLEVEIANPFASLYYPPVLNDALKEMGPAYAVAVGAALRGLE